MNTQLASEIQWADKLPGCEYQPPKYNGPSKAEVLKTRQQYCNPGIFTYYREPLMITNGYMQYLFDEQGRRYLDLIGGIVTISCGHCHPKVIAETKKQIEQIQHTTTIYLHPNFPELAKKLAEKMPAGLELSYFTNSGSEANDLAIMMARLFTGNFDIIALKNGYHGGVWSTMGLTSHNTWKFPVAQGFGVHHVTCPDPYRSPYAGDIEALTERAVQDVIDTIRYATPGKIAAFIAEPFQGVGGVTAGGPSYLKRVYQVIRDHGGICIADEVQTGFGRTGDHYWGFQNFDVVPDMVTMAKGIGNGIPLAGVTTRKEIAETLRQKIHFNTFGGNPVSMAQGLAVLKVIEEERLQENARVVGGYFKDGLLKLQEKHRLIGDVRGKGLMLGVELVRDRKTKEPATTETALLLELARERNMLVGKGGLFGNVLRVKPPLCVTKEDIGYALEVLDNCLTEIEAK